MLERIRRFLAQLIDTRRDSIGKIQVLGEPWPAGLEFSEVPFQMRTRNTIAARGLHKNLSDLPYMYLDELLRLRGMGPLLLLDFACTMESAFAGANATPIGWRDEGKSEAGPALIPDAIFQVLDEPWVDCVSEADPRFADLLPPGRGTIAERIEELVSNPSVQSAAIDSLAECLPRIRARLAEMEKVPLESQLAVYLEGITHVGDKRLRALVARLHWGGARSATTLEEAGSIAGITRERLRQLQARYEERKPSHPVVMPTLDKALTVLEALVPISAQHAAEALVTSRCAQHAFHPASLIAAATALGRAPALHLEEARGVEILVSRPSGPLADRIARVAYRQARACGASNVMEVAAEIAAKDNTAIETAQVRELLRTYSEVEFLTSDWFWCPSRTHDSIWKMSRRVLAVTSPVDVATLREGIRRSFAFRLSMARKKGALLMVPPRSVLLAYYKAHPDFVVLDNDLIKATRPLDYRVELTPIEQGIVDALRSTPTSVLDRVTLAEECTERGVNTNSLWTMLSYSPAIESLGNGLWTLRGIRVDPAAVEAIRRSNQMRPRERRILDFGWAVDGRLWVAIRLPSDIDSQVFGMPSGAKRYLADRDFQAESEDGTKCGRIRVYDSGLSAGYDEFLRRSGADEDDILLARFDLVAGLVSLSLIGDEALEELSPEI